MKNCTRNKFMVCFRPTEMDLDDDRIAETKMMSNSRVSEKKPSFRRSFSAVFKSTVLHSSLSKKARDIHRSKSYNQFINEFEDDSKSPTSTLGIGPTPGSSFGSYDLHDTDKLERCLEDDRESIKEEEKDDKGTSLESRRQSLSLNHLMYLVVLTLLVTVLCSKSLAVVITTVWIFSVRIICLSKSSGKLGLSVCFLLKFVSCSQGFEDRNVDDCMRCLFCGTE